MCVCVCLRDRYRETIVIGEQAASYKPSLSFVKNKIMTHLVCLLIHGYQLAAASRF